jgi:hypothetical protein
MGVQAEVKGGEKSRIMQDSIVKFPIEATTVPGGGWLRKGDDVICLVAEEEGMVIRRGGNVEGDPEAELKEGGGVGKDGPSKKKACSWHFEQTAILQETEHERHLHRRYSTQQQKVQVKISFTNILLVLRINLAKYTIKVTN